VKCPRCDAPSAVVEATASKYRTTLIKRRCDGGHAFTTYKVHQPQGAVEKHGFLQMLKAISEQVPSPGAR
jgi:transcriptional regulator NrdR family protein